MGLEYYDDFLDKVADPPRWHQAQEQVRRSSLALSPRASQPPHIALVRICICLCPISPPHPRLVRPQVLVEPYAYLASIPGKEVRSALIASFNTWMQVPDDDLDTVKKVVGMLHTASLLCASLSLVLSTSQSRSPIASQDGRRRGRLAPAARHARCGLLSLLVCRCPSPANSLRSTHTHTQSPTRSMASRRRSTRPTTSTSSRSKPSSGYAPDQASRLKRWSPVRLSLYTLPFRADADAPTPARRAAQPAPRPRDGPVLAREPHLPNRARVHRHGQQQYV